MIAHDFKVAAEGVIHHASKSHANTSRLMMCPNRYNCEYDDCRCHCKPHAYTHRCSSDRTGCPKCTPHIASKEVVKYDTTNRKGK